MSGFGTGKRLIVLQIAPLRHSCNGCNLPNVEVFWSVTEMALTPVHLVAPLIGASHKAMPVTHINPQQVWKATLVVCCKLYFLDKVNISATWF